MLNFFGTDRFQTLLLLLHLPAGGVDETKMYYCRLDNQEMDLRDYSNLQKEFDAQSRQNKDLIYRWATTNGLLEVCTVGVGGWPVGCLAVS